MRIYSLIQSISVLAGLFWGTISYSMIDNGINNNKVIVQKAYPAQVILDNGQNEQTQDDLCSICYEGYAQRVILRDSTASSIPSAPTATVYYTNFRETGPSFQDSNQTPKKLSCGHTFHTLCIKEWFKQSFTCPMCRKEPRLGYIESMLHKAGILYKRFMIFAKDLHETIEETWMINAGIDINNSDHGVTTMLLENNRENNRE